MQNITQTLVQTFLRYDQDTGVFTRLPRPRNDFRSTSLWASWTTRYADKPTGAKDRYGYVTVFVAKQKILAHRLAWLHVHGATPINEIDHINGVRDDNRLCNLRLSTRQQNVHNRKKNRNNLSGVTGVRQSSSGRWLAQIGTSGTCQILGYFSTFPEAVAARKLAEAKYGYDPLHGRPSTQRAARALQT